MSTHHYSYEHKIVIERHRPEVLDVFLDYDSYQDWQPNLLQIDIIKGPINTEGHILHLHYKGKNNQTMIMEERLVELTLPHKIIQEYRLGPTRNVQTNYFESYGLHTMWIVHTDFYFEQEPPAPQSIFESSTKQSLLLFKKYVEAN